MRQKYIIIYMTILIEFIASGPKFTKSTDKILFLVKNLKWYEAGLRRNNLTEKFNGKIRSVQYVCVWQQPVATEQRKTGGKQISLTKALCMAEWLQEAPGVKHLKCGFLLGPPLIWEWQQGASKAKGEMEDDITPLDDCGFTL